AFAGGAIATQRADGGCSSCGSNDATATYDDKGNLVRLQNARGYITQSDYSTSGRRLLSTTTALVPAGCDPETDAAHCRLSSASLATASLSQTTATLTTNYTYADPNWPSKPTLISRSSVIRSGGSTTDAFT